MLWRRYALLPRGFALFFFVLFCCSFTTKLSETRFSKGASHPRWIPRRRTHDGERIQVYAGQARCRVE